MDNVPVFSAGDIRYFPSDSMIVPRNPQSSVSVPNVEISITRHLFVIDVLIVQHLAPHYRICSFNECLRSVLFVPKTVIFHAYSASRFTNPLLKWLFTKRE